MKSIRGRLGWSLGGILGAMLLVFGLALFLFMRHVLVSGFDTALFNKARLFAAGTEALRDGTYDFEMIEAHLPEHWAGSKTEYVEFRDANSKVLIGSPSLEGRILCGTPNFLDKPEFFDATLLDGGHGRMVSFGFVARPEEGQQVNPSSRISIAVAVSNEAMEESLERLAVGLSIGAIALLLSACIALWIIIKLGLTPLGHMAEKAAVIGPDSLSQRFDLEDLPDELLPIAQRLNELLTRLQAAFARERRFTADAAHELRTPVAELRTLAEVGLMEIPPENAEVRGYLNDAQSIAIHLERLITGLLALARFESGNEEVALVPLDLCPLLNRVQQMLGLPTRRTDVEVDVSLPAQAIVSGNEMLARILIENLLGNAITYAESDGKLMLSLVRENAHWRLSISNTTRALSSGDIPHLFEPFWRKSTHRGGEVHAGLGLALAAECARLMRVELRASLSDRTTFLMECFWRVEEGRELALEI